MIGPELSDNKQFCLSNLQSKENIKSKLLSMLGQCASSVSRLVPWVHQEWENTVKDFISKVIIVSALKLSA